MSQPPWLRIEGARQNNLKNVSVAIPHDRVTVITGVSGSGKSSLAFDTLFAEGQWRYIESLSTYARMFLERLDPPHMDPIEPIRPAHAPGQETPVRAGRVTAGTATDAPGLHRLPVAPARRGRCPDSFEPAGAAGADRASVDRLGRGAGPVRPDSHCPASGVALPRPQTLLFSFNHPLGACPECKGFGNVLRYDEARVVPDQTLSLADGAVEPWSHPSGRWYQKQLLKAAKKRGVDATVPYAALPEEDRRWVYDAGRGLTAIRGFFDTVHSYP